MKTAWEKVQIARQTQRPKTTDYIKNIFNDFIEFHGDRNFGDDKAIIGGIALLDEIPVTVIGEQKGKSAKENMERNFGMPEPEGYRKALRLMKQAEKFKRPIITFIDTPGAYPGVGAEERGQGEAIAKNIMEMSKLKVPIICIVIGEGSSGGALAIGVGDKIVMLENAVYSILSPEGFASILYKDASKAKEAAENMKITAEDLKKLEIIEKIIEEPEEGVTEKTLEKVCTELKKYLKQTILELQKENIEKLLEKSKPVVIHKKQETSQISQALRKRENMILSILLTGNLDLYQVIKINVKCDEFKDELNKKIAQKLYEEFEKGNSNINAILDKLDEKEQGHITEIMADDYEIEDMEKAIDDIIQSYQREKLVDRKMQILTLLEEQSENVEKKELEKELIEIVNQLARMK